MEDNQTYSQGYNGLKLTEKVRIELNQNNHLTKEIKQTIIDLIQKMVDIVFPLDESILPKLRELAVYEKSKYRAKGKSFVVEGNNVFVAVDQAFEKYGDAVAGGMLINYLFPNKDKKTEALYQNMMIGILNLLYGNKNTNEQFRVNELLSILAGSTVDKGLSGHPLIQPFCQGNMATVLLKIKQKMINGGTAPEEAESKISELLKVLDYNNQLELPNFLVVAQRKIAEIYFLTKPLDKDIPSFTAQLVLSSLYFDKPEEREKYKYLDDFGVEYKQMVDEYLEQKKLGITIK